MTTVGAEVRDIYRPHFAARGQLGHPHETGICQIHWAVSIFLSQRLHSREFKLKIEGFIQPQIATLKQTKQQNRVWEEACRLSEDGFASNERRVLAELPQSPIMIPVIPVQKSHDKPSVGDVLHGWNNSGAGLCAKALPHNVIRGGDTIARVAASKIF